MSQICDNTTPLGSKGASEILTESAAALQEAIIDLNILANQNNIDVLDRNTVVVSTNALNNILSNMDLSELDSLQAKFDSDDGITYTDLAEFAVSNGVNMTELKDELVQFNAKLPNGEATNADLGVISDTTGQPISTSSSTVSTFDTGSGASTPVGGSKISTKPPTDLLAEIQRASNITGLLSGRIPFKLEILPDLLAKLLKNLDFHFANNIGSKLTDALCSAFNDVSSKITKAFAVIDNTKVLVQDVTNLLEKDPKKLLEQMKQRATLETLVGVIENVVKKALEAAKNIALAAVGGTLLAIKGLGDAASTVMKKIAKEVSNITEAMSEANTGNIIKDIEAVVANLASSFERLTPEAVSNLMFKMCQKAQDLQGQLMAPAQKLNRTANSIAAEVTVLKSQEAQTTQKAVKAGAIRVEEKVKAEKKEKVIEKSKEIIKEQKKQKEIKPVDREADIITERKETPEEQQIIMDALSNGFVGTTRLTERIGYSDRIGLFGGREVDEIRDTNPLVLAKLIRMSELADEYFDIVSGTMPRLILENINDSKGAMNVNMHNTGWAVDISADEFNRQDLIVAASQVGFTGIGVTPEFIHLDLGARRGFQKGLAAIYPQDEIDIQAILDKHEIDGFRKKRS